MQPIVIIVWDMIGNVLLGVNSWEQWGERMQNLLLQEDPDAVAHAPGFNQIFADYVIDLRKISSLAELDAQIAEADYLVIHKQTVTPEVLRKGRRLRLIQHLGLDYRGVPLDTAREMGVPVAATPLVNYLAVAEHTWALILNHLKRLYGQREAFRARSYTDSWGVFPQVRMARDLTLGLLGFGEIARPVARIARAFDMRTIYWDVVRFPELEAQYQVEYAEWDEIFTRSDVLSVHLALNERTEGIIGVREIALMKPDALFVNTARGKLVDQAALTEAVRERRLAHLALDVFAIEPLPVDDPLHAIHEQRPDDVTLTIHSAWQGPWTWMRDSQGIWFNVLRSLRGEPIDYLVQ